MQPQLSASKHFQVERLTDGVYAAIASEQGHASCNAGLIDIGDRTVIFDTFLTPEAARDLLKTARKLTLSRIPMSSTAMNTTTIFEATKSSTQMLILSAQH